MGADVKEFKRNGADMATIAYDGKTVTYKLNSGIMDDTKINDRFGFSSFLSDADRKADVGIAIKDNKLYYDITTPVGNALIRDVGMFEDRRRDGFISKNSWFASKVVNKGAWNLKYREDDGNHWEETLGIPFWGYQTEMVLDGYFVRVEDVGNITYGYLGTAVGFSQSWLNTGSSVNHFAGHGVTQWDNERADQANFAIGINWYNTGKFK